MDGNDITSIDEDAVSNLEARRGNVPVRPPGKERTLRVEDVCVLMCDSGVVFAHTVALSVVVKRRNRGFVPRGVVTRR